MLKGVNKTIIEVNNLNSKIFTKAILFVDPDCVSISGKRLKKEAVRVSNNLYDKENEEGIPPCRKSNKTVWIFSLIGTGLLLGIILFLFINKG